MKPSFKDACDECGKFNYCKGIDGKVLCPECEEKRKEEQNNGNKN